MYTTAQHTREGWTQLKADLDAGQTREISETIAEYLGAATKGPTYRDLDGTPCKIWRSTDHRYYVQRTR